MAGEPAFDPLGLPPAELARPPESEPVDSRRSFAAFVGGGVIAFLAVAALAVAAAAAWYYNAERRRAEGDVAQELAAVAGMEVKQIANWRGERLGDGHALANTAFVAAAARVLEGSATHADAALVSDCAARLSQAFHYSGASLLDRTGLVHYSSSKTMRANEAGLARDAIERGDAVMSDLALENGRPMMHVAVPIRDLGALVLDIDPERFLYPYLEAWPGTSSTAESILVRREGQELVYLSPRRNLPDAPLFQRRGLDGMATRSAAQQDAGWYAAHPDYRGVPAFGTVRHIPGSPWYLICKIDYAEAISPVKHLEWELALPFTHKSARANIMGL